MEMERYERETNLSIYWFNRANDLRGAAGAVWFAIENDGKAINDFLGMESGYSFSIACPSSFLMLCGLSLELIFKAILIEIGEKPPKTHNLRQLASQASVVMDNGDLELIEILADHVLWAGKYPIPTGGRTEWDQHVERMVSTLMSPIPGFSIKIIRPNHRLDWGGFERIWNIIYLHYRELRSR